MTFQIWVVLITFIAFIAMILSGKVKIHVAALAIPIILELTQVLTTAEAWSGFMNSSVIMMASMFVVGAGLGRTDIVVRLSRTVIKSGASDRTILLGLFVPVFFLCCIVNSTATITIMLPIITSICIEHKRPLSKFIYPITILSLVWAGAIPTGGNAGNYLANNAIIEGLGGVGTFDYFTDFISKIPFLIVLTAILLLFGTKIAPDSGIIPEMTGGADGKNKKGTTLGEGKQKLAFGIFLATVIGVVACAVLKIPTWYPSVVGAFLMVICGILSDREAIQAMSSPIIFIFVGTLPLSKALSVTGADAMIANAFNVIFGNANNWIIMISMYLICSILTQFMSNSAVNSAFKTLSALVAVQGGFDARAMMLAASMGSANCYLLPTAGPVTVMAYEAGKYKMKDYIKQGLLPSLLHLIIFAIYIPIVFPLS